MGTRHRGIIRQGRIGGRGSPLEHTEIITIIESVYERSASVV
jgi:hypothetical protein